MKKLTLYGRDYPVLGAVAQQTLNGAHALLSVGSDADSPARSFKGDQNNPNEDALLIVQDGPNWLFAIADGHFGHHLSHMLIDYLAQTRASLPSRLGQLALWLTGLEIPESLPGGSTLLVACAQESTGEVFGFSFGDCSLVSVDAEEISARNRLNDVYIRADSPLDLEQASHFQFRLKPGQTLLLFSDGINECCYRAPQRSVQLSHLHQLYRQNETDLGQVAAEIVQLALAGVDGQPGGQDNIALIAWRPQLAT